jgi:hypothetical protein
MSNTTVMENIDREVHASSDKAFMDAYLTFSEAYSNFKFSFIGALKIIENEGEGFTTKNGLDGPEMIHAMESSFSALNKAREGLINVI